MSKTFRIGDIVTAKVTGVQNYGYMDNVHDFVKVGQEVTAKVIDVDEFSNKISLSIRALEKLDVPDFPQRIKKNRKRYTPSIGFSSLAKKLPIWIEEAQEKFVKDKNKS